MKRIITSTLLLSALALFSACQKSEQQAPAKGESIVFTASFAPETKTVLSGKQSLWNQDEIRIFNGKKTESEAYESQKYVTKATNAATAEFEIEDKTATFTGDKFIAVCPNSLATNAWWNASVDRTINKLYLKPEQTATVGTYDPEGHVAVAYTENTALSFKNACALLKFTVKSDNIKEVCVYATDAVLSGNFSFNTEGSLITTDGDKYEKNNYVKVVGDFVNGQTYYMSCIPGTLANGFTLEVVNDKAAKVKDNVYTKPIELKRNSIYNLGEVTYTERPAETRTFYLKAGDWANDGAVIDAWIWGESITGMWIDFEKIGETTEFKAELPKGTTGLKLYRRSPTEHKTHEFNNNRWNTSGDLTISDANDCLTFKNWNQDGTGWEVGNYSK